MRTFQHRMLLPLIVVAALAPSLHAQTADEIEFHTTKLTDNVYMLAGAGGNLALFVGEDCALLVDTEYGALHEKLLTAVKEITDRPIHFAINTHWHFDHVGGNEKFGEAGVMLVAHENVRKRLSTDQVIGAFKRKIPASPPAAWPTITYTETLTFHFGDETIRLIPIEPAHTDGDSFVHFEKANVLHVGDVLFNGMYPFIDATSGGSIDGMIAATDRALEIANDDTKIIPGHGALATPADLRKSRDMLKTVRDRIAALIKEGKSRDEIIAAKPTKDLDADWTGSFDPDAWVGIVYDGMKKD